MVPVTCLLRKDWNFKEIEDSLEHDSSCVNQADSDRRTPLFHALTDDRCPVDVIKLLIRYGADVNFKGKRKETPLHVALKATRDETVICVLLENGANVLHLYKHRLAFGNQSALCIALHNNASKGVVQLLLDAGCPLNWCEQRGHDSAALICAANGNAEEDVIRMLIQRGADVNAINNKGESVMCHALANRSVPDVEMMWALGASLSACTFHSSAFFCAKHIFSVPLTTDLVQFLLDKGAPLDQVDGLGLMPLQHHLLFGNYETGAISLLLHHFVDVNALTDLHYNLLGLAMSNWMCCDPSVVKLLIKRGVRVDNADRQGFTALNQGAKNCECCPVALKLLLRNGAEVNAIDWLDRTPLASACTSRDLEKIRILLAAGAHVRWVSVEKALHQFDRVFEDWPLYDENIMSLPNLISCYQLLLKYTLLENSKFHIESLAVHPEVYEVLSKYWGDCADEQRRMKRVVVGRRRTLNDFLKIYSTPSNEEVQRKVKDYDFSRLLKIRASNEFPFFGDVISDKVDRWIMNAKLTEVLVYVMKYTPHQACEGEKIFLDYASKRKITKYLNDDDLCRLIVAFIDMDEEDGGVLKSKTGFQYEVGNLLKSRSWQSIWRCSKALFSNITRR